MKGSSQPPQRVPVLTEVVVLPQAEPEVLEEYPPIVQDPAYADTAPAPLGDDWPPAPAAPDFSSPPSFPPSYPPEAPVVFAPPVALDEAMVTQRVLADLEKQLDLMFEHRLRETLTPVLARLTDTLVREMRNQLAVSLREMVARAVSLELDRLQRR